jgi:hypothetical protein
MTCTSKFLGIMWLNIPTHYGKRSRKLQYFDIFHFSPSYSLDNVCYKIYFETRIQQLSCASQNGLLFLADFKFRRYLFSVAPTSNRQNSVLSLLSIFMFAPCIFSIKILLLKSNKCTLLVMSTLNKIKVTLKVTIKTPTCFGSRRNHHQGVPQCLIKTIYMVLCTSMVT